MIIPIAISLEDQNPKVKIIQEKTVPTLYVRNFSQTSPKERCFPQLTPFYFLSTHSSALKPQFKSKHKHPSTKTHPTFKMREQKPPKIVKRRKPTRWKEEKIKPIIKKLTWSSESIQWSRHSRLAETTKKKKKIIQERNQNLAPMDLSQASKRRHPSFKKDENHSLHSGQETKP